MWRTFKKNLPDMDKNELLELIGLESRRSSAERVVPALAIFGAGVLVGVGLGLLLAPSPGRQLRGELSNRLGKGSRTAPVGSASVAPESSMPPV